MQAGRRRGSWRQVCRSASPPDGARNRREIHALSILEVLVSDGHGHIGPSQRRCEHPRAPRSVRRPLSPALRYEGDREQDRPPGVLYDQDQAGVVVIASLSKLLDNPFCILPHVKVGNVGPLLVRVAISVALDVEEISRHPPCPRHVRTPIGDWRCTFHHNLIAGKEKKPNAEG
jgi:hypothetical protein